LFSEKWSWTLWAISRRVNLLRMLWCSDIVGCRSCRWNPSPVRHRPHYFSPSEAAPQQSSLGRN
jgi:hypothetical protein